ncbi:MAG: nicotinate phosphoribosyltransferase [Imperialibacter sp.]|uniref:nicotinate phosphoribosyltransferase n=1 Tax=Imperialibacter sp. TaxID=2038411 RepID=UPI0032EFAD72
MKITKDLYSASMALLTDLYQLTMAYGYWKSGKADQNAVFNLFFRNNPFGGGYTVACGLEYVVDYLNNFHFSKQDLNYLAETTGNDGQPLFEPAFLEYLANLKFTCDIEAVPEGTIVFPHEPMVRVTGSILQCQLIETPLLNLINFQTLVATKASRIYQAAGGDPVMEFGLRRAQGIDGALAASRSAFIGGCTSTSNVMAGKLFGIPVSGTHAHSWVMSFDSEQEAFETYAEAMPNNTVLLVDTYDTEEGIRQAIAVGKVMQAKGQQLMGIRIDSGDLAYFSQMAREMLDEAGLKHVKVVASNDLDENLIQSLKLQEAKIDVWGIGTKLVTAYDQPALGAVYKLSAIENNGKWEYKLKLSEQTVKMNNPGIQQVKRFNDGKQYVGDMIFDVNSELKKKSLIIDPMDATKRKTLNEEKLSSEDLLVPVFKNGRCIYDLPDIRGIKQRHIEQLAMLDRSVKRFVNPHVYPVGLEESLHKAKTELILKLRRLTNNE